MNRDAPGRTIVLETVFRQKDSPFLRAINRLRLGTVTEEDAKLFKSLDRALPDRGELKPTILNPRVRGVDQHNAKQLARLSGREFTFEPTITFPETGNKRRKKGEADRKAILKCIQTARVLKKGAQVMLTANLDLERGLCNGARGVVLGFKRDEEEAFGKTYHPVVRFDSVGSLLIREHTWSLKGSAESGGGGGGVSVRAIPLILAYAITIHKSQGQTIDYLDVDLRTLGTWREPGLVYTALSRARSADGLRVRGFDAAMVVSNAAVRDFYARTPRCAA